MLQKSQVVDKELISKSEANYLNFVYCFGKFISNYFTNIELYNSTEKDYLNAEKQTVQSLLLIEKVHMYLFYSHSSFGKYLSFTKSFYEPFESERNYQLFRELQRIINKHHFIQEINKTLCQKSIEQILTYYSQNSGTIEFILSPVPKPWTPQNKNGHLFKY